MRELIYTYVIPLTMDVPRRIRGTKLLFYREGRKISCDTTTLYELSKKERRYITHKVQELLKSKGFQGETQLETLPIDGSGN